MSFSMPAGTGGEVVTQENLLLSAVERIAKIRLGRLGAVLHLSRLRPQNRQDGHMRIALRMLEPMVNAYRGQMFQLANSDVVFLVKDPNMTDVENMIYKLRALFSKDPLTFQDAGDGVDRFCSWYDLSGPDYDKFLELAKSGDADARAKARQRAAAAAKELKPIDAKVLGELVNRLVDMDIVKLVRRQAAIRFNERRDAAVMFQEYFVGATELREALAPEINILANRWLFQHLSLTLDRQIMKVLGDPPLRALPPVMALNLNISTVLSQPFADFLRRVNNKFEIAIEFQVLDVLSDSRGYYEARKRLREAGHFVTMDNLTELTLQFMDVGRFEADLYKVNWSPEMREADHSAAVLRAFDPLGRDNIIMARCDSEASIKWGIDNGINKFQGRYVDTMLAAYTMAICDKKDELGCTLPQCSHRHSVVAGPPRPDCGNHVMLDSSPVMTAKMTHTKNPEPAGA